MDIRDSLNRSYLKMMVSLAFAQSLVFPLSFLFLLSSLFGLDGIWLTALAADGCTAILSAIFFVSICRKLMQYTSKQHLAEAPDSCPE